MEYAEIENALIDAVNDAFNECPPDGSLEKFRQREQLAFHKCIGAVQGFVDRDIEVVESLPFSIQDFARLMFTAGRLFEMAPLPVPLTE